MDTDKPKSKNSDFAQPKWIFDFRIIHILILIIMVICLPDPLEDNLFRQIYTKHGLLFAAGVLGLYAVLAVVYEFIYQKLAKRISNLNTVTILMSLGTVIIVVVAVFLYPSALSAFYEIDQCLTIQK